MFVIAARQPFLRLKTKLLYKLAFEASINHGEIVHKCAFGDEIVQPNTYVELNVNPNLMDSHSPT